MGCHGKKATVGSVFIGCSQHTKELLGLTQTVVTIMFQSWGIPDCDAFDQQLSCHVALLGLISYLCIHFSRKHVI